MIKDTHTSKGTPAITSDHWHVVHSHFSGDAATKRPFVRIIISEHDDRRSCRLAAQALSAQLADEAKDRPLDTRDEAFARPPHFRSLKAARRMKKK